jgi:hypothetical protein
MRLWQRVLEGSVEQVRFAKRITSAVPHLTPALSAPRGGEGEGSDTGRACSRLSAVRGDTDHAVWTFWQRAGAAADAGHGIDRQQPGLPRVDREQCRGGSARVSQHLCRRAPFHRLRPGLGEPQPVDLARRAHLDLAARHRCVGPAMAQPGIARRAGRNFGSAVRRKARFRGRQGLSLQRIRRLLRQYGRGRCALRRGAVGHHPGLHQQRAV